MIFEIIQLTLTLAVLSVLWDILGHIKAIHRKVRLMGNEMDALIAEVAEVKGIVESAIALINGLVAKLEAAAGDPAQIAQVTADIKASADALAAAVAANTPPTA